MFNIPQLEGHLDDPGVQGVSVGPLAGAVEGLLVEEHLAEPLGQDAAPGLQFIARPEPLDDGDEVHAVDCKLGCSAL